MILVKKISEIRQNLAQERDAKKKIALVPTMGALHRGHFDLVKKAKENADIVVVSIFVNKAQFNDLGDFEKYPRQLKQDLASLEPFNVDYVFAPPAEEIFASDFAFKILPTALVDCLCGATRPGHFDGVALIVSKLFNIIKPNLAVFGEKDFQQLQLIQKLVSDFNFDVEILPCEIKREVSGLAMSSRNQRLSQAALAKASQLFTILNEIKNQLKNGEENLPKILQEKSQKLLASGFEKIDYLEIRQEKNLKLVEKFDEKFPSRIFVAAQLEGVRLIDNLTLN